MGISDYKQTRLRLRLLDYCSYILSCPLELTCWLNSILFIVKPTQLEMTDKLPEVVAVNDRVQITCKTDIGSPAPVIR